MFGDVFMVVAKLINIFGPSRLLFFTLCMGVHVYYLGFNLSHWGFLSSEGTHTRF